MGFWGQGIFENDCAEDIRCAFESYLQEGLSIQDVIRKILTEYTSEFSDATESVLAQKALSSLVSSHTGLSSECCSRIVLAMLAGACCSDLENSFSLTPSAFSDTSASCIETALKKECSTRHWIPGDLFALKVILEHNPFGMEEAQCLAGEYLLIRVIQDPLYKLPKGHVLLQTKFSEGGRIPHCEKDWDSLEYVQINSVPYSMRLLPYHSEEEIPPEQRQIYHLDAWGRLQEFTLQVFEAKSSPLPQGLVYLGNYKHVSPPVNNFVPYQEYQCCAWNHLIEYCVGRYCLHNLHKAAYYACKDGI